MSLKLLLGRAGTGKTQRCFSEIKEELRLSPEGSPLILLLPEQATFQAEMALLRMSEAQGFIRAHIVGFRRLAYRVLTETGGLIRPQITNLGKRMAIELIILEQQAQLKIFGRAAKQKGFAEIAANMLKEFKNYDITPEQLCEAKDLLVNPVLSKKLHDLEIIYRCFEQFLAGRYIDPEDYLRLLVNKISQTKLIKDASIWLDGFAWFTPQEYKVIEELLQAASQVTITLCMPPDATGQAKSAFERQNATRQKLLALAHKHEVPASEEKLTSFWRFTDSPLLGHIEEQLISRPIRLWQGAVQGVVIAEAANRQAEVEGIARDIIRLCREEGCRFRDIAILIRDYKSYSSMLNMVLTDHNIPFFSDGKRAAAQHPLAELLRSAGEIVAGRWSYEAIFRCLKTDLFPVTRNEVDVLENYVLEFGIRGSRWTTNEPWQFQRRISLEQEQEISQEMQSTLDQINQIRNTIVKPLSTLEQKFKQAVTAKQLCSALFDFLAELAIGEELEKWALKAELEGDLVQATEHRRMLVQIGELFEQIVDTFGEQELTLDSFVGILNEGLEALEVNLIPPGLDFVTVSPLERTRLSNVKAVYIPGVNDGILPGQGNGDGILSELERNNLAQCGLELAFATDKAAFDEQFLIYSSFALPSKFLWISYSLADDDGGSMLPSYIIKRLHDITGVPKKSIAIEPAYGQEEDYLAHPRASFSYLAAALRKYTHSKSINPIWWDVYNWAIAQPKMRIELSQALSGLFPVKQEAALPTRAAKQLYYRNGRLLGSVTRFEGYRACPFKHFAKYGLKLKQRAIFQLKAPDFGQFLHAVVKEFGERLQSQGRDWGSISYAECEKLCGEVIAEIVPKLQNEILLSSGQYKHLAGRLRNTAQTALWRLAEFGKVTEFKPHGYEIAFGDSPSELPPLTYTLSDNTVLWLTGKIDRLDVVFREGNPYVLVIDYKTGGSWLKLSEIIYGLKLQLLTYLLAVCRGGKVLFSGQESFPAGILYCFLKRPQLVKSCFMESQEVLKELNNKMKMPGWTLDDAGIVALLDSQFEQKSEFLKIARNKDGNYSKASRSYLKSVEEFKQLMQYTEKSLLEAAEGIMSGDVAIKPYIMATETACDRCEYRPICQFDPKLADNEFRILKKLKDEEALMQISAGRLITDLKGES